MRRTTSIAIGESAITFVARQSGRESAAIRMRICDRNEGMMFVVIVAGKGYLEG
jgi:hypothetical protein